MLDFIKHIIMLIVLQVRTAIPICWSETNCIFKILALYPHPMYYVMVFFLNLYAFSLTTNAYTSCLYVIKRYANSI